MAKSRRGGIGSYQRAVAQSGMQRYTKPSKAPRVCYQCAPGPDQDCSMCVRRFGEGDCACDCRDENGTTGAEEDRYDSGESAGERDERHRAERRIDP